jgi:hypothetical protein
VIHRAAAIPATARRPAATEPMFFVAAPVKVEPGAPAPVFDGATGTMGDPVAAGPDPEPAPPAAAPEPEAAAVPVATGAVPVANPDEPAIAVELGTRISWARRKVSWAS